VTGIADKITIMRYRFAASLVVLLTPFARAEFPGEHPWAEVTYHFEKQTNPAEEIHTVIVDLSDHKPVVRVSRSGADPDGDGPWQTTLMPVRGVADREEFDIAINGDFFSVKSGKDAEGAAAQKVFQHGIPAVVTGPAMTDGLPWSKSTKPWPILIVHKDGHLSMAEGTTAPPDAVQVIAGHDFLVHNHRPLFQDDTTLKPGAFRNVNPRTAIGIDESGTKLYLLVVDGRSDLSRGMTYGQLSRAMVDLGCFTAINLDGGGSSTLVIRDPETKELKVLNHPSDRRERPVANVLGVRLHATTQPSK
jgi:exopolysaccharide biosynthesis protein